ncbi:MAG: hypothetical protein ACR2PI_19630, partial [Hyphomicrobiaceae bacterium]
MFKTTAQRLYGGWWLAAFLLSVMSLGNAAHAAEAGLRSGAFTMAQARTPEERAKRRAARQQRRKERAAGNGQARPAPRKPKRAAPSNRPPRRAAQPARAEGGGVPPCLFS